MTYVPPATRSPRIQMNHDSIIDFIIANPTATYKEVANVFNYTEVGIGIIVRSDSFQARYHARKAQIVDPLILANVEDRMAGLAMQSIGILQEKLTANPNDANLALKTLDLATRGTRAQGIGQTLQNNFIVHLPGPASSTTEWSRHFNPEHVEVVTPRQDALAAAPSEG